MRREVRYSRGTTVKTPRDKRTGTRPRKAETPDTKADLIQDSAWRVAPMSLQDLQERLLDKSSGTSGVLEAKIIVDHAINQSLCSGISAAATMEDCETASRSCGLTERQQKSGLATINRLLPRRAS